MGESSVYKFPYPENSDTPDVPYWQKRLADKINNTLDERFQYGSLSVQGDGNLLATGTVVFPHAFATVPTVVVVSGGGNSQTYPPHLIAVVADPTTTGFTVKLRHITDNTLSTSFSFMAYWLATDL